MDKIKLLGKQRAEFSIAQKQFNLSRTMQFLALIISISVIFFTIDWITYVGSIINLVLALLWQIFYYNGQSSRNIAEKARRATLLSVGLDFQLKGKYLSDLQVKFKSDDNFSKKFEDESYFKSEDEIGFKKLLKLLEESAFWTKHLYSKCFKLFWVLFTIAILFSVISLFLIPSFAHSKVSILILNVFALFLTWLITGDLLKHAIEYTLAYSQLDDIENRIENISTDNLDNLESNLLLVLGDYNAVVQTTALIPAFIYSANKKKLNELWNERS